MGNAFNFAKQRETMKRKLSISFDKNSEAQNLFVAEINDLSCAYLSVILAGFVIGTVQEMQLVKKSLLIFRRERIAIDCLTEVFERVMLVFSAFV